VLLALLYRLTGSLTAAWLAAAFWAVHPLRVESVAWVSQRKDVLSTLLGLLAIFCHLRAVTARPPLAGPPAGGGRPGWPAAVWSALALFGFALAFLAKPTVVTYPALAGLMEYAATGRVRWRNLLLPVVLAAGASALTILAQQAGGAIAANIPWPARVLNAVTSVGVYLRQTLVPCDLAIPYSWHAPEAGPVLAGALACLGLAALFWVTGCSAQARRCGAAGFGAVRLDSLLPYAAGIGWFVVALGPMIGLIQLAYQAHADRYTSWPSLGLAVAMAWGVCRLERQPSPVWRRVVFGVLALWVAGLALLSARQAAYWRDTETLFERTLQVTGANDMAHSNLGIYLFRTGRTAEGVAHLREAARLVPAATQLSDLVQALLCTGEMEEAEQKARLLRDTNPAYASLGWYALGRIALQRRQFEQAEEQLRQALHRDDRNASIWNDLGLALRAQQKYDEAASAWRQALQLEPAAPQPRENLARLAREHPGTEGSDRKQ
jgi:Flp pilus assembly protein TadD